MTIKSKILSSLPTSVSDKLYEVRSNQLLKKFFLEDMKLYKQYYAKNIYKSNQKQLESLLIFHSHSLEKGFSHTEFRKGFGKRALSNLSEIIKVWNDNGYSHDTFGYMVTLSCIKTYRGIHKKFNYDDSFLNDFFTDIFLEEVNNCKQEYGGYLEINGNDKTDNIMRSFEDIAKNRVSIREYSSKEVSEDIIKEIVQMAVKTPSVCNRQPAKLYCVKSLDIIEEVLKIQGGFNGFRTPPVLYIISTSLSSFISPSERNEAFIDGGLFSMSVLYAIESLGLGACALNAMLPPSDIEKIQEIVDIPKDEVLITFISSGYIPEKVKVPLSKRKPINEVYKIIG